MTLDKVEVILNPSLAEQFRKFDEQLDLKFRGISELFCAEGSDLHKHYLSHLRSR